MSSQQKTRISRFLPLAAASLSAAASLLFGFLYFTLYWPFRGQFNEEGRYLDEADLVVHHEQSGLLIVPVLVFLALAILFAKTWWVDRKPASKSAVGEP